VGRGEERAKPTSLELLCGMVGATVGGLAQLKILQNVTGEDYLRMGMLGVV